MYLLGIYIRDYHIRNAGTIESVAYVISNNFFIILINEIPLLKMLSSLMKYSHTVSNVYDLIF